MSVLKEANLAFRNKEYDKAASLYGKMVLENNTIKSIVEFNLKLIEYYKKNSYINSTVSIDIIIPVFNALEDVKKCLESVEKNRAAYNVTVIIVNDASDQETSSFLNQYCVAREWCVLIENQKNMMYTRTVNEGLRRSKAEYIVTLNSDTVVTKGWLDGLVRCMKSSSKIGIVGPLSNAASWQNVPVLLDENNQFAVNSLPLDVSADDMAELVSKVSRRRYPRLPFVNGFCLMIARKVVDAIGFLDEESFPTGYGEENDYCIRALDAGFDLAIADDTYVYHAKSKSFGHERRKLYSKNGTETLKKKYTEVRYLDLVEKVKDTRILDQVRDEIITELQKLSMRSDDDRIESNSMREYIENHSRKNKIIPFLLNNQLYSVDIVIPVYNALDDVKKCLMSLCDNREGFQGKNYIINDASDLETSVYLRDFCKERSDFILVEHEVNQGYTKTGTSELLVFLKQKTDFDQMGSILLAFIVKNDGF
ncbi:glycosyltransferase family 2 protein [Orrella sp. 11846]|uniref:glycosyltransferase family 2 protein n=1 Tax=Orrella sp. 11846 TaxID=3409913 RepID=UPI003B5B41E6